MPGGADLTSAVSAAMAQGLAVASAIVTSGSASNLPNGSNDIQDQASSQGPYRPSQWASGAALYSIVIATPGTPPSGAAPQQTTMYVFDAVLIANHNETAVPTKHPIQTGSPITDHIYLLPAVVTLEIGMSDAMDEFTSGMWTGAPSKSVSAWLTLKRLKDTRQLLVLNTRLNTYSQMVITDIQSDDTNKTTQGLKARVRFEQIFLPKASTTTTSKANGQQSSARPNATNTSPIGSVASTPVPAAVTKQNMVPNIGSSGSGGGSLDYVVTGTDQGTTIPGAGNWSSNNVNTIPSTTGVNPNQ